MCLDIRAGFVIFLPLLILYFNELNCAECNIPVENKTRAHKYILFVMLMCSIPHDKVLVLCTVVAMC